VQKEEKKVEKKQDLIRDKNTVGDYYKAWNQFDADKELERLEEEAQRPYRPYNPYEDTKNNKRAKPKTKINVHGRRAQVVDPTELKDKGNLHFQCLEFDKAINCYSECLKKLEEDSTPVEELPADRRKLRCVVLSNRAMAYLKTQETIKAL
jgi:tetratricopeptide (TPR) repeat protein